jgi:hypothetical protein
VSLSTRTDAPKEVLKLKTLQGATAIRAAFWVSAVVLGAAQTWYMRHRIFSDGTSYLAIAQAYVRGDWHNALSTYWSPFYSWLLAAYLVVFRPSAYWEASSLHVVNYFAFLAACWTFEKFTFELMRQEHRDDRRVKCASNNTVLAIAYVTILYGGLVLVGIGYPSPDMIAYAIVGYLAWLTLRFNRGDAGVWEFIAFGAALGVSFLDRSAFSALIVLYLACGAAVLRKRGERLVLPAVVMVSLLAIVVAPFLIAVYKDRGRIAFGDTGKLNYGWEVNGAARWSHWQGEPYNIGKPSHPERLILKDPVPVFEFGEPVGGPYPPWYDPSYWYEGIRPRFDFRQQLHVLLPNLVMAAAVFLISPALPIALLFLVAGKESWRSLSSYLTRHYLLLVPVLAGIGMYCLIYVDKRYLAGFVVTTWILIVVGLNDHPFRFGNWTQRAAQAICVLGFAVAILYRMAGPVAVTTRDLIHGGENDWNFNWMLAQKLEAIGLKKGERVAFIGLAKDADWVRILECRTVAEVPIVYETSHGLINSYAWNLGNIGKFLKSDEASREEVYEAFRKAGAVIAIGVPFPDDQTSQGWTRLVDASAPHFPKHDGQFAEQFQSYYRWLVKRPDSGP